MKASQQPATLGRSELLLMSGVVASPSSDLTTL